MRHTSSPTCWVQDGGLDAAAVQAGEGLGKDTCTTGDSRQAPGISWDHSRRALLAAREQPEHHCTRCINMAPSVPGLGKLTTVAS